MTALNLLTDPLLLILPKKMVSLAGLLALLARDEVDSYPALRPHQEPAWHMFLVQLAALALHRAGTCILPETEDQWTAVLRGLTPDYPGDEPWCLVVEDSSKPAFFQPPIPAGVKLDRIVPTPDALDLLITSRNHDLKAAVAHSAEPQDWIYSLVSLQTSEGQGGRGNYGIARMNKGYSSRVMLGIAPLSQENIKINQPRHGAWFRRDVTVLLLTRVKEFKEYDHLGYPFEGGLGLTWLGAWDEEKQLTLGELDIWFIEICRRVRFSLLSARLIVRRGTSKGARIAAEFLNGAVGDPWAPVHTTEPTSSLTLSEGKFDYRRMVDLLLSGNWKVPTLASPTALEGSERSMLIVAKALSRGQGKTHGFRSRILPIAGKISRALTLGPKREELQELANKQIDEIKQFDQALRKGLAVAAVGGNEKKLKKVSKADRKRIDAFTREAHSRFDDIADHEFFAHLWVRFEAQEAGADAVKVEALRFAAKLLGQARVIFEETLPVIPCGSLFRPRAEARARSKFQAAVIHAFPELFPIKMNEEADDAVAG